MNGAVARAMQRLGLLCLGLMLWGLWTPAAAVQRALLVGVSELVNQPSAMWLTAPRNDVMLMRKALINQGLAPPNITVLADGVDGAELPTAPRIHQALRQLLDQSRSGDVAVIYFSGHGTRWRDPGKSYSEPDGLSENFLARDARGRIDVRNSVAGGLRDAEFDAWIQAFLARNVFVWAVFDTCSATSMTRSTKAEAAETQVPGDEVRFRGVRAEQLASTPGSDTSASFIPTSEPVPRARYVAFFASESHQVTPELKLPRGARQAVPQGLLTWAVVESLNRKPATWRDLFNGVLSAYSPVIDELEKRFPTRELPSPVAEGLLDAPLLSNAAQSVTTAPQWLAQRAGASLIVPAGELDGLQRGLSVLVKAQSPEGGLRTALARVTAVELANARVDVPASLTGLEASSLWTVAPQEAPRELALRVSGDIDAVSGLSLDFPASVELVRHGAADLRIEKNSTGFRLMSAASPDVQLLNAEHLSRHVRSAATFKWLNRLVQRAGDGRVDGFSADLQVLAGSRVVRSDALGALAGRAPLVAPGQQVAVEIRNASGASVDLLIAGLDGQGRMHAVFPSSGAETNRFESGTRAQPSAKRFALPAELTQPGGRLVVLATPARPRTSSRLFGWTPPMELADVRVRGQAPPSRANQTYAAGLNW